MSTCIIIDDEQHAIDGLTKYISAIPGLELVASFTDPIEAQIKISLGASVDLILLDIDMPGMSGLDLAKEIRHKTKKIVFTTAHSKYAIDAWELLADAYLVKPYTLSKFASAMAKVFLEEAIENDQDYFFVKNKQDDKNYIKILYREVIQVESDKNYVKIHLPDKTITTYLSLSEMFKCLEKHGQFYQFQRSYIISIDHITCFRANVLTMSNGKKITVGNSYSKQFREYMSKKVLKAGSKI